MFRLTIRDVLQAVMAAFGYRTSGPTQQETRGTGFWTFASDREWPQVEGGALDCALKEFIRLKQAHGDVFNVVIEDLHAAGSPTPDGEATAKIYIKIYVSP